MTTVVYHKDKIYTDRRGIFTPSSWSGVMNCLDCGSTHYGSDTYVKIEVEMFQNGLSKYDGSKIIAVAGAGDFDTFRALSRLIQQQFPFNSFYEIKTFASPVPGKECNILIVTENKAHAIWFSGLYWEIKGSVEREESRSNPRAALAMGSGKDYAIPAITLYKGDGLDAIRLASLSDKYTSSALTEFDCETLTMKQHEAMSVDKIKARLARLARNIAK